MKNKKGYTLTELIITLAVVGIMIIPIFNTFITSHKINLNSERRIGASYLAQSQMEKMKSYDFEELKVEFSQVNNDPFPETEIFTLVETIENVGVTFNVTTSIENVTSTSGITKNATSVSKYNEIDSNVTFVISDLLINNVGLPDVSGDKNLTFTFTDRSLLIEGFTNDHTVTFLDHPDQVNHKDEIYFDITSDFTITDKWNIEVVNNSGDKLFIGEYDDVNDSVSIRQSQSTLSNDEILIRNNMQTAEALEVLYQNWYKIIVEVEYDGIKYEVIESTIGM